MNVGIPPVTVDGVLFEDCPDLAVGYIREPDRIQIRYVRPASVAERASAEEDEEVPADVEWAEFATSTMEGPSFTP